MIFINSYTSFPVVVQSQGDPNYNSVSLFLHADNNFVDSSPINATMSTSGTAPIINTSIRKFGSGSVAFNGGTLQHVVTPSGIQYSFGSGDFTIECWLYPTSLSYVGLMGNNSNSGSFWVIWNPSPGFCRFETQSGISITSSVALITNRWTHFAISRSGTTLRMFYDGVQVASLTSGLVIDNGTNNYISLGGFNQSGNISFIGNIDDFRITKGVARYTTGFIPLDAPFPDNIGAPYITANLQAYYDFSNASSYPGSGLTVTDLSGINNNLTFRANPTFVSSPPYVVRSYK
jgi:hypothetical protein